LTLPDRIIRIRTVIDRTSLSRSTIYRQMDKGTFPQQVRISVTGAGWRESDINKWIEDPVRWRSTKIAETSSKKIANKESKKETGQFRFNEFD
jgi:prophage regulatory protein